MQLSFTRYHIIDIDLLFYLLAIFRGSIGDIYIMNTLLPSILVPLVGLVFPAIAITFLFIYIEKDEII